MHLVRTNDGEIFEIKQSLVDKWPKLKMVFEMTDCTHDRLEPFTLNDIDSSFMKVIIALEMPPS
jgi:hypothetical protein